MKATADEKIAVGEDEIGDGAVSHPGLGDEDGTDDRSGLGSYNTRTGNWIIAELICPPSAHLERKTLARPFMLVLTGHRIAEVGPCLQ